MNWTTVERPGYFGRRRDLIQSGYDDKYGKGNWRLAHEINGTAYQFKDAIQIYEDAYYEFLKTNKNLLDQLCVFACEVYDNEKTNVDSGLDYTKQENYSNHYQDISVRRVVFRLGRKFEGKDLVHIRHNSISPIGVALSPGYVPFHLPALIIKPVKEGWWKKSTVEEFWQSNKILQVKQ